MPNTTSMPTCFSAMTSAWALVTFALGAGGVACAVSVGGAPAVAAGGVGGAGGAGGTGGTWGTWGAGAGAADCCAPAGCAGGAGRGGAVLGAAALAGMSSGEGPGWDLPGGWSACPEAACALGGTGLVCSVIGVASLSRCHNVRCSGIKKPLVPGGSRGVRAGAGWSALCAPAKYQDVIPLHAYTLAYNRASRQIIADVVSLSETSRPETCYAAGTPGLAVPLTPGEPAGSVTAAATAASPAPVPIRASTPETAIGRASRNPCP